MFITRRVTVSTQCEQESDSEVGIRWIVPVLNNYVRARVCMCVSLLKIGAGRKKTQAEGEREREKRRWKDIRDSVIHSGFQTMAYKNCL